MFKKPEPRAESIHQVAFATPDGVGPEAINVQIGDYATFDASSGKSVPRSGTVAILHLDFRSFFPAISWVSDVGNDAEFPTGFAYRVLSARHEPSGDFECVVVRQVADGSKTILQRFVLPKNEFPAGIDALVGEYETLFSVRFARRDLSQARTPEEFNRLITGSVPPTLP